MTYMQAIHKIFEICDPRGIQSRCTSTSNGTFRHIASNIIIIIGLAGLWMIAIIATRSFLFGLSPEPQRSSLSFFIGKPSRRGNKQSNRDYKCCCVNGQTRGSSRGHDDDDAKCYCTSSLGLISQDYGRAKGIVGDSCY